MGRLKNERKLQNKMLAKNKKHIGREFMYGMHVLGIGLTIWSLIVDFMHTEKNVTESLVGTFLDTPFKTEDGLKARLDLESVGIKR